MNSSLSWLPESFLRLGKKAPKKALHHTAPPLTPRLTLRERRGDDEARICVRESSRLSPIQGDWIGPRVCWGWGLPKGAFLRYSILLALGERRKGVGLLDSIWLNQEPQRAELGHLMTADGIPKVHL